MQQCSISENFINISLSKLLSEAHHMAVLLNSLSATETNYFLNIEVTVYTKLKTRKYLAVQLLRFTISALNAMLCQDLFRVPEVFQ